MLHVSQHFAVTKNRTAFRRAKPIIAALATYRTSRGSYPDSLEALVPAYLLASAFFRDLGADVGRADVGVCQLDVPVPEDPETLPDTPTGRLFKAVAVPG